MAFVTPGEENNQRDKRRFQIGLVSRRFGLIFRQHLFDPAADRFKSFVA